MVRSSTSFPFFVVLVAITMICKADYGNAQTAQDSSAYYYRAILSPKSPTDLPDGISYYLKRKERHLALGDTLSAIHALRLIAIGQYEIGTIYDSENSIVEALQLIDGFSGGDTLIASRTGLYNQLGRIYRHSKNSEAALTSFANALAITETGKDSITILNNMANVHKDLGQYAEAEDRYAVVLSKCAKDGDSLQLAMALDNLGFVQAKQNLPGALNKLSTALSLREAKNDRTGSYSSYKNLATYHLDRGETEKAYAYAEKAYETAKALNGSAFVEDALALFMKMDEDPRVREYKEVSDSLANAKQLAANKNAFMKYNLDEEREKVQAAELAREQEKRSKLYAWAGGGFLVAVLLGILLLLRYRHKKEKLEGIYKTESRISKQVHDEVANDLYRLMLKLQHEPNVKEELLEDLDQVYHRTRDISKQHSALELEQDFEEILTDLLWSYNSDKVNVLTHKMRDIDWSTISRHRKTAIYRVLQELMTNMIKHSRATVTTLRFLKRNNKIHIEYSDNGIGCDLKKRGGLQNAETRIKSVDGSITFKSENQKGFKATIIA